MGIENTGHPGEICSDMRLITWRVVVAPWQEISQQTNKQNKTEYCFLSDQEDVLRETAGV